MINTNLFIPSINRLYLTLSRKKIFFLKLVTHRINQPSWPVILFDLYKNTKRKHGIQCINITLIKTKFNKTAFKYPWSNFDSSIILNYHILSTYLFYTIMYLVHTYGVLSYTQYLPLLVSYTPFGIPLLSFLCLYIHVLVPLSI